MLGTNAGRVQQEGRIRETLRFKICREWRQAGRLNFTDADLEAEIDKRIEAIRRKSTSQQELSKTASEQQPSLFDRGHTSQITRSKAHRKFNDRKQQKNDRKQQILQLLREAGAYGQTRNELAEGLGIPVNHVTKPVDSILGEMLAHEPGNTRLSQYGRPNAVIVLHGMEDATDG